MQKISNNHKFEYIFIIGLFFFAHCLLVLLPAINLEFAFVDAARYFKTGEVTLIDQYFQLQANTVGLPILSSLVSFLAPGLEMLIVIRLLSASGIILLGIAILNLCDFFNRKESLHLLILILLNPLIWVFSARATSDFLPAALGLFAISIVLKKNISLFNIIFSGVLLGLASILKYHAILFLFLLVPFFWDPIIQTFKFKYFIIITSISLSLLAIFLIFVFVSFGFWITPPAYQSIHGLKLSGFFNNFFLYFGYLTLLCAPSSLIFIKWQGFFLKYKYLIFVIALFIFFLGYVGFHDGGELNFGPFDRFINKSIFAGLFLVLSLFFLIPSLTDFEIQFSKNINKALTIAIILIIALFSLTRPAQRYLLIVIPIFIFLIPRKVIVNKHIFILSIIIYVFINIFIAYSQWCTGTASQKMVDAINSAGLINISNPGVIEGHVGNQFKRNSSDDFKYIVIAGEDESAKIKVQSGISFISKKYSLVEISKTISTNN